MALWRVSGGPLLKISGGGLASSSGGGGSSRDLLVASDVTLAGQQKVDDANYGPLAMAVRYVGGERRFLIPHYPSGTYDAGALVEYRLHASGLKNGGSHWTLGNVPNLVEVRRWNNWTTRARMVSGGFSYGPIDNFSGSGGTMVTANVAGHYFEISGNHTAHTVVGRGFTVTGSGSGNNGNYTIASSSFTGGNTRIVVNESVASATAGGYLSFGGNGVAPSAFYWDEANQRLWYTWQPWYGAPVFPNVSAATLADADAGGDVADANVHGPYYFNSDSDIFYKGATCGMIPIPADRQAEMGASFLSAGHHCAIVGTYGARGVSLWAVGDLPDPLPAPNTVLWSDGTHIYHTGSASGVTPYNMKIPNISYPCAYHGSQGSVFYKVVSGVASRINDGDAIPLAVNDCLYQYDHANSDTITLYMNTGATGGAWVPEIYNGSAWVEPSGWAVHTGNTALSATENVFYWPKVTVSNSVLSGIDTAQWVRLRRTSVGSSGGSIKAFLLTASVSTGEGNPDRPMGLGGVAALGAEQYDATHYSLSSEDFMWGGAWVQTDNVEGLAYFGAFKHGGVWYGAAPAWMQPYNGGTPFKVHHANINGDSFSNGGKCEGTHYPYFFVFDPDHLVEAAAGARARDASELNPVSYARIWDEFPGVIAARTVPNSASAFYGDPMFDIYGYGSTVVFDAVTNQLVVLLANGSVSSVSPILALFQVR